MTPWSDPVQGEKAALEKSYDGLASRAVQHDRLRLPPLSTALTTLTQLCVCCYALCAGEPAAEAAVCVASWHVSKWAQAMNAAGFWRAGGALEPTFLDWPSLDALVSLGG